MALWRGASPPTPCESLIKLAPSTSSCPLQHQLRNRHFRRGQCVSFGGAMMLAVLLLCAAAASAAVPASTAASGVANVSLVLLKDNKYGATCLDGSPPGFYHRRGWGSGANKWVIFLQGGGWCATISSCATRSRTVLGSTKYWKAPGQKMYQATLQKFGSTFTGLLSGNSVQNPSFYNWNSVMVFYCDGGGFAGDRDEVNAGGGLFLNFHGQKILKAVIDDLKDNRGLDGATHVLFGGCSAGGQAISMACDGLADRMPSKAVVKCMMDAGFFLDGKDVTGQPYFRQQASNLATLQNMAGGFDKDCLEVTPTSKQWQCFFPQYNLQYVKTPVFIINSIVDYAAIDILNQGSNVSRNVMLCLQSLAQRGISIGRSSTASASASASRAAASAASTPTPASISRSLAGRSTSGNSIKSRRGRSLVSAPSNLTSALASAGSARVNPQLTCSVSDRNALVEYSARILMRIQSLVRRKPGFGHFVMGTLTHCTTIYPSWSLIQRKGVFLRRALHVWYFGTNPRF